MEKNEEIIKSNDNDDVKLSVTNEREFKKNLFDKLKKQLK